MDKRLLESLVAIYRTSSLVDAAQHLNISQSALSRRLSELQSQLGVALFKPSGRGITATAEADRLVPLAIKALEGIMSFEAAARLDAEPSSLQMTIAATCQIIEGVVADHVVDFMRLHPNFSIRFLEAGGAEIEDLVLSGKAMLGLTARPRFESGLVDRQLARLDLLAVCAEPFSAAELRNGIDLKVLFRRKLMILDRRYQSRLIFDAALRHARLTPSFVHEGNSTSVILALARAGMGTGIIPSTTRTDLPTARISANGAILGMDLAAIWDPTARWRAQIERFAVSLALMSPALQAPTRPRSRRRKP